jgi:hypothetical protein
VSLRHRFTDWLFAGVSLDPRMALADTLDGAVVEGTGGVVLSASPTIAVRPAPEWTVTMGVSLALGQWLRGGSEDGLGFSASVQWVPSVGARRERPRLLHAGAESARRAL